MDAGIAFYEIGYIRDLGAIRHVTSFHRIKYADLICNTIAQTLQLQTSSLGALLDNMPREKKYSGVLLPEPDAWTKPAVPKKLRSDCEESTYIIRLY